MPNYQYFESFTHLLHPSSRLMDTIIKLSQDRISDYPYQLVLTRQHELEITNLLLQSEYQLNMWNSAESLINSMVSSRNLRDAYLRNIITVEEMCLKILEHRSNINWKIHELRKTCHIERYVHKNKVLIKGPSTTMLV